MSNDWYSKFFHQHGIGAREKFQEACFEILSKKYPSYSLHLIRVSQGDQGIDILSTHKTTGEKTIYQCKFFDSAKLGSAQKQQIKESFTRAYSANASFQKWSLCIPIEFSVQDFEWWNHWSTEQDMEIELLDGPNLILFSKEVHLYNQIFAEDVKQQIAEIHAKWMNEPNPPFLFPKNKSTTKDNSILGFLLDCSEQMTLAISKNTFEKKEDLLERILNQFYFQKSALSKNNPELLQKILTFFLGYSKRSKSRGELFSILFEIENFVTETVDLFAFGDTKETFLDLLTLNSHFESIKKKILENVSKNNLFTGGADLENGLSTSLKYFEMHPHIQNKILVILTTGEITKDSENQVLEIAEDLKKNVIVFVIYLNQNKNSFGKSFQLYDSIGANWDNSASRAFHLASEITSDPFIYNKTKAICELNQIEYTDTSKFFFPMIPEKTLTFLKYLVLGEMDE